MGTKCAKSLLKNYMSLSIRICDGMPYRTTHESNNIHFSVAVVFLAVGAASVELNSLVSV